MRREAGHWESLHSINIWAGRIGRCECPATQGIAFGLHVIRKPLADERLGNRWPIAAIAVELFEYRRMKLGSQRILASAIKVGPEPTPALRMAERVPLPPREELHGMPEADSGIMRRSHHIRLGSLAIKTEKLIDAVMIEQATLTAASSNIHCKAIFDSPPTGSG